MDRAGTEQTREARSEGQSAVEFALTFLALLVVILAIIEFGRLLQVWLTVQNSAQERRALIAQG